MNAPTQTLERPIAADFAPPAPKSNLVPFVPQAGPKAYPPKMAKALLSITREIGAVTKDGLNKFHNYNYQKWEDVLNRISPLLAQHGIIISQSEVARSLFENDQMMSITYAFTIVNEDGDLWPDQPVWTAIARAKDQKGIPDDKAGNKCHTQAHKYFLLHLFNIRTVEIDDSDADGGQIEGNASKPKPPKPGSQEAQAMEGPRTIQANGHNAESWAAAFVLAIEQASPEETIQWMAANKNSLAQLEKYPEIDAKVEAAVAARANAALERAVTATPTPPKPPRPGSAPKPAVVTMPDPATDAPAWVAWLIAKLASFETYEAGETFWNDVVQALDLPSVTQEDAMGAWRRFEERFSE